MSARETRRTTLIFGISCVVIGVAGGWWLRGDTAPSVNAMESAALPKSHADPAPPAVLRESSPAEDSTDAPIPFATAIRASLDDRDPFSRGIRIREIIRNLSAADLPAAVAEAARLTGDDGWEMLHLLGLRWGEVDAIGGIAFAANSRDDRVRRVFLPEIAAGWAAVDLAEAVAWMKEKPGDRSREEAFPSIIAELARTDPASAAQFLAKIPAGGSGWTDALLRKWMNSDARAAVAWVQQLPPGSMRRGALRQAMGFWVQQDGRAALDWLARDPTNVHSDSLSVNTRTGSTIGSATVGTGSILGDAFAGWADRSPDEALAWALAQTDEEIHKSTLPLAIKGLAEVDSARAAQMLSNYTGPDANWIAGSIASSWFRQDPVAATRWAQNFSPGDNRDSVLGAIASDWAKTDSAGAAQWLGQLPAGLDRDYVILRFTSAVAAREPILAIEWTKTISDVFSRADQFEHIARIWAEDDPNAAKKWMRSTDQLSAEYKKQLIEKY